MRLRWKSIFMFSRPISACFDFCQGCNWIDFALEKVLPKLPAVSVRKLGSTKNCILWVLRSQKWHWHCSQVFQHWRPNSSHWNKKPNRQLLAKLQFSATAWCFCFSFGWERPQIAVLENLLFLFWDKWESKFHDWWNLTRQIFITGKKQLWFSYAIFLGFLTKILICLGFVGTINCQHLGKNIQDHPRISMILTRKPRRQTLGISIFLRKY